MDVRPIEPLEAAHDRQAFSCGQPLLDKFLHELAMQYEKRHVGRTYVALQPGTTRVTGYYTLAAGSIPLSSLPPKQAKKLPRHKIPAVLLGRLAVDQAVQGQGLGKVLLLDALQRSLSFAAGLGIFAVEVHAIDEAARRFYMKFGFEPLLDDAHHLYLTVKTIKEIFPDS